MAEITAKINAPTSSGPKQVSVALPSGQTLQNSSLSLKLLGDVDVTSLDDGALLQYRASDGKFVSRIEIVTTTGTLTFNGGTF
jgi:hypothetical protein